LRLAIETSPNRWRLCCLRKAVRRQFGNDAMIRRTM
jgi:hypothetical protein